MFLYEQIEQSKNFGAYQNLPSYLPQNLNRGLQIRPYQESAFCNFITYFENERLRRRPTQTLFHMATGSGKTLVMAGLMLYLYKKGYRNFLFFVNLDNIVQKTKDNFLNPLSSKYLFGDRLIVDGEEIHVKEVSNFQESSGNSINVCFSTIQGLHSNLTNFRENSITFDDFRERNIVFISDEAHHINADTKKGGKRDPETISWEEVVNRMYHTNPDNVLLEFTATCEIQNPMIKREYEDKIVYEYPLRKFREDGFSKEVKTLQSHIPLIDRMIQATLLSQYRMKLFQDFRLNIKPVMLFKARTVNESKASMKTYLETISSIDGKKLSSLAGTASEPTIRAMYDYFERNGITFDQLAQELREDFSAEHCISVNDNAEAQERQIIVNSLEDRNNPFRAVFEVKKLDEGWDVLNLFDIVRLYETRDAKAGKPGGYTIAEAQLIGRGARYCPFNIDPEQDKYKRKFDNDLDHPLRVCEELYYHCQYDSKYITELHTALRETGIMAQNVVDRQYRLKDGFRNDDLYRSGLVFTNERTAKSRKDVNGLLPSIRDTSYRFSTYSGITVVDSILEEETNQEVPRQGFSYSITIRQIAEINYNIVHRALRKYSGFNFKTLLSHFPNLRSMQQFITDPSYLGEISLVMIGPDEQISVDDYYRACVHTFGKIETELANVQDTYIGTTEFVGRQFSEVFRDKRVHYTDPTGFGQGISQSDPNVPQEMRLDLSSEDWFVFQDNYGTSEEKSFVAYFSQAIGWLRSKYDKVYLVRNERQLHIYSFSDGERFEPDYLLFLQTNRPDKSYEQLQIFVEPKGDHLIESDAWKEKFLLEIETRHVPVRKFIDDNKYCVWGFPFYNRNKRMKEFSEAINRLKIRS